MSVKLSDRRPQGGALTLDQVTTAGNIVPTGTVIQQVDPAILPNDVVTVKDLPTATPSNTVIFDAQKAAPGYLIDDAVTFNGSIFLALVAIPDNVGPGIADPVDGAVWKEIGVIPSTQWQRLNYATGVSSITRGPGKYIITPNFGSAQTTLIPQSYVIGDSFRVYDGLDNPNQPDFHFGDGTMNFSFNGVETSGPFVVPQGTFYHYIFVIIYLGGAGDLFTVLVAEEKKSY